MSIKWTEHRISISKLKPYEKNPRRITESQYGKLKASITDNGYHQRLIVTPDFKVIGGHQRLRVLAELGITEVEVLTPDRDLTEDEYRRMLVQDNLPFGEFDFDMLANDFDLDELKDWGMPDYLLGNYKVADTEGLTDPDAVPDLTDEPIAKTGDIWLLGNHRLMCGDSTKADDVAALLGDVKPHLMVTDPPYGVEYDANWRNEADRANGKPYGARAVGKVQNDSQCDWREAWSLFPGNIAYVWHAGRHAKEAQESLEICGFKIRNQIIWAKNNFAISRGDYHWQHEPCWYAVKGKGNWCGDRSQTTLWQIDKPLKSETGHSTQKPVECMKRPIENNSSPGQAVYEPFSGSGTTIIAGEMTGRHIYAMEISPAYVSMAIMRWQNFTGLDAVHEATGQTYKSLCHPV